MGLFRKKELKQTQSNQQEVEKEQTKDKKVTLTLYACNQKKDFTSCILSCFKEAISDTIKENEEFTLVLQDYSKMTFYKVSQEEEIVKQINGMTNYYAQAPMEDEKLLSSILQQIQLFNTILGVTFTINEEESRTNYLLQGIYKLAKEMSGFVLYPTMELFHPDQKLLISIEGKSDFTSFYPIAASNLLDLEVEPEQEDIKRKQRSIQICIEKQIPYAKHLNVSVTNKQCAIPSKEDIIHRFACVFFTAVTAEICVTEKENAHVIWNNMNTMIESTYHVYEYLTEEEREYLSNPFSQPDELHAKYGWRYECCAIFLWALNLLELNDPTKICEASQISDFIWSYDFEKLCQKSTLRSKEEILDLQDLIYRYDWACVDARIHNATVQGLDCEIIYEWHYALNWLTTAGGISNWDAICPNT